MLRLFALTGFVAVLLAAIPAATSGQAVPEVYLYVNDLASPSALLQAEYDSVEDLCYQVDAATSAEIAILIVNTTAPMDINAYAVEVFQHNGIGKVGRDNGVLLVVATDDRLWRFEVGYGLEGILPDSFVFRVGTDNLTPALQSGDFYGGIYDAIWAVGTRIVERYDAGAPNPNPDLLVLDWKAIAIVIAVFIGIGIVTRGRSFLWLGALFSFLRRGKFGGGRSGGGGARGGF